MQTQSGFFTEPLSSDSLTASQWVELPSSGGRYCALYRCRKSGRSRLYKGLRPDFQGNPLYESLLRKEFEIGFSLTHPAICEYYSLAEVPGKGLCIEMEWIEGRTLEDRLAAGIDKELCRKILLELCDALDYMHHRQVFHRDLKPLNIMITDKGNNVKIIDFGFSDADGFLFGKEAAGTRAYAAPELLANQDVDGRADLYSLGMIMRRMPPAFAPFAAKCTRERPEDRYRDAAALKAVLERKSSLRWLLPLLGVLLMAVLLVWFLRLQRETEQEPFDESIDAIFQQTQDLIRDAGFPTTSPQE